MAVTAEVKIYTQSSCGYCVRALDLLKKLGVDFHEISIDGDPTARAEMERLSHRHTTPQIFIHTHHVGGCDDLFALVESGQFEKLLGD